MAVAQHMSFRIVLIGGQLQVVVANFNLICDNAAHNMSEYVSISVKSASNRSESLWHPGSENLT